MRRPAPCPQGERYITPAGDLSFSVLIYCITAAASIVVMSYCRTRGGELGGPKRLQWLSALALTLLWLLYIVLSGVRSYGHIKGHI